MITGEPMSPWRVSFLAIFAAACGSAGPYGYSRTYAPLSEESEAAEGATPFDPIMAQRLPDEWKGKKVSLFGLVKSRDAGSGGASRLKLSLRTLEDRNLCDAEPEDTCRVTVGEREHAVLHALVALDAEDDLGAKSVGPGSLLRIVGTIGEEVDPSDGTVVIRASYYRHWPRNHFVTTAARSHMRR